MLPLTLIERFLLSLCFVFGYASARAGLGITVRVGILFVFAHHSHHSWGFIRVFSGRPTKSSFGIHNHSLAYVLSPMFHRRSV
jgi:hypothetical protein